jgi:hypothetical protein
VLSPECLNAFNATSSVRPLWEPVEGLGDYGDTTGDWYIGRNESNASDDNTNFTMQGIHSYVDNVLPLHPFITGKEALFYQVVGMFHDYRISSKYLYLYVD